jgi:alkanesulfonate monooxygenase SsuD/methylene tetrahydromethanopterin reductase-like flavin-dependent oxidoreductase (luciferase family)
VQVDLLLDPFGARWAEIRDAALAAAAAGFSGIWTWDHLDGRVDDADDVLEAWTVLTAVAVAVPDVAIGPLVLNVANRDPGLLAVMAATLQDVSGGRLLLGLGAGGGSEVGYRREQAALGRAVPADPQRRAQVAAGIEEIRRLWRTPGFLEPTPPPPFVIGAFGPKMAELAGRVGDGVNTRAAHPRLRELLEIARSAHAVAGRDPSRFLVTVFTELDDAWLNADSAGRRGLSELDVDRLILFTRRPHDRGRIATAGRLARGAA